MNQKAKTPLIINPKTPSPLINRMFPAINPDLLVYMSPNIKTFILFQVEWKNMTGIKLPFEI